MRYVHAIIAAGAILTVGVGAYTLQAAQEPRQAPRAAEHERRMKEWAYVAREKALSPSEDLRMVVVPSEFGRHFDVRCLIYRNKEAGSVTFVCPDARQEQLEDGPER